MYFRLKQSISIDNSFKTFSNKSYFIKCLYLGIFLRVKMEYRRKTYVYKQG